MRPAGGPAPPIRGQEVPITSRRATIGVNHRCLVSLSGELASCWLTGRLHRAAAATLRDLCASTAQGMGKEKEGRMEGRKEGRHTLNRQDRHFVLACAMVVGLTTRRSPSVSFRAKLP